MNCLTARQTMELARPDESDGAAIDEAAQHVKSCPTCQTTVRRREQFDTRIGELCRDVPVPAGLKERLLTGIEATGFPAVVSPVVVSHVVVRPVKPKAGSRRRWLAASLSAVLCLVAATGSWLLLPHPPLKSLDEIAGSVLSGAIKSDELPEFTQFTGGLALRAPATMMAPRGMPPARRLVDSQLGDREVAIYFFTFRGPRGRMLTGRLAVVPAASVKDVPAALSFPGPTLYKSGFCTTAWVEGGFVYLCCVNGGEAELPATEAEPEEG